MLQFYERRVLLANSERGISIQTLINSRDRGIAKANRQFSDHAPISALILLYLKPLFQEWSAKCQKFVLCAHRSINSLEKTPSKQSFRELKNSLITDNNFEGFMPCIWSFARKLRNTRAFSKQSTANNFSRTSTSKCTDLFSFSKTNVYIYW